MNDLSEKEQLQEMRAWWAENGRFVMTGIVLGIVMIVAWNQWRSSIEGSQIEASNLFEDVMSAVADGDTGAAEAAAHNLYENYPQTVYPEQTRLAMARLYMDKGRDQDAADTLRALVVAGDETELQMVGRLRLAKVLLYQNKAGEVIELLNDRSASGFTAQYKEVLGDAYVAEGNFVAAQEAYEAALRENQGLPTIDNNLIQLKLNDLPDLAEVAATTAAIEAAIDDGDVADEPGTSVEDAAESETQDETAPDSETE